MDEDEASSHVWLKETGHYAQLQRHDRLGCFVPALLWLLTVIGIGFAIGSLGKLIWIPLITGTAAVLVGKRAYKVLHNEIYCPRCGYNPTRRKSDGAPRKDHTKVLAQLERYQECPECAPTKD